MGINSALFNGWSGLNSFSTAMTVVSDNVANADTTAFKSASVRFGDMVNTYLSLQSNSVQSAGSGSAVLGIATDHSQGNLRSTAYWSDVAVSGEGFFITKELGSDGTTDNSMELYTRDGSFRLDKEGYLVNQQGNRVQGWKNTDDEYEAVLSDIRVLDQNGDPKPEAYSSFRIDSDGTLHAVDPDADPSDVIVAKLGLAGFRNKNGLVRQGDNTYIDGPEIGFTFYNGGEEGADTTKPDLFGDTIDYSLESSNVDLPKEMVSMIIFQADYNANSKTISTSSNMLDTAIGLVR